ncbi:MAG: precorrin-3B C(17)-methyltransferase [Actinomycetota bacterium]|nr:precorrin-3B C(17)-methyltransferase [Actinomycetota bacterium]
MSEVLTCSVSAAGAAVAARLPFEHRHGGLVTTVASRWDSVESLVLICATGVAVRAIAPLLGSKSRDPGVVCVDDNGRWVIALCGGHRGGANVLARQVAALLDAEPVVTTASDMAGLPALDTLTGYEAEGDVAGVTRRWLDGEPPALAIDPSLASWPLPVALADLAADQPNRATHGPRIAVTDSARPAGDNEVLLRPRSLVLGVGASRGAGAAELHQLVLRTLTDAGLHVGAVGEVATVDRKADEPAIVFTTTALGVPMRTFPASVLAGVTVPNPSKVVLAAVGTPSVAEAAALAACGANGRLVVPKQASTDATVAIARRSGPTGHLAIVGTGPGHPSLRTPAATAAVRHAETVIGYGPYVDLVADLLEGRHQVVRSPIGAESDRCAEALRRAAAGQRVALVCSGDAGVYAMASLVFELAPLKGDPSVTVVPGVTAALSAAAVLGAPLGHDHAAISLSDLLTPWAVIRTRLLAAASGDFVVSLYNPRSERRTHQLVEAREILAAHRPPSTPAAIVTDAGRQGQAVVRTTIADLDPRRVGMLSIVIVGSSTTRWIGPRMVTPRGYQT